MRSLRIIACAAGVAAVAVITSCASEDPFTLQLWVNDQSALPLSVDRGTIEPANPPFSRIFATWDTYDEALGDPGVLVSNGQSSLTVRVRDCQLLNPEAGWFGTIVHQIQSIAVAVDGTITLVPSAGWECSDSDGHAVAAQP